MLNALEQNRSAWEGQRGGRSRPPQTATSGEVVLVQWGVKPPTPPRQIEHCIEVESGGCVVCPRGDRRP